MGPGGPCGPGSPCAPCGAGKPGGPGVTEQFPTSASLVVLPATNVTKQSAGKY